MHSFGNTKFQLTDWDVSNNIWRYDKAYGPWKIRFSHFSLVIELNYCSSIWGKCSEKLQYEVQKCVNIADKVASNGTYLKRNHVIPLLRDLKWIIFNSILRLNEASFMNKNLYVSADSNVKKTNFDIRNKVSQRITRSGSDVQIIEEQLWDKKLSQYRVQSCGIRSRWI